MDSLSNLALTSAGHHLLNLLEESRLHNRGMPSLVLFALEGHESEVVAVPQHGLKVIGRQGLGRVAPRPCAKTKCFELLGQGVHRVVIRRVELKCSLHEGSTIGINRDRSEFSALELLGDVEIAERGPAEGAASSGLFTHLV